MSFIDEIVDDLVETASAGSTGAGAIAVGADHGFSRGTQEGGTKYKKKKKKIPLYMRRMTTLSESTLDFDKSEVVAKINSAEKYASQTRDSVGFALELEDDTIVKVYVTKDDAEAFDDALKTELQKNSTDEYKHRELGEILYKLKNDFDIINIIWPVVDEDEETDQELDSEDANSEDANSEETDQELDSEETDSEDPLPIEPEDTEDTKSALASVIDMMKADAEAKKAEAEAKKAEAEAKISGYATKAAQEKLKQEEEILDMEAYNKRKKDEDSEAKRISSLAKYQHDMNMDDSEEFDFDTNEHNIVSGSILQEVIDTMKRK